jgi:hypothetical protein
MTQSRAKQASGNSLIGFSPLFFVLHAIPTAKNKRPGVDFSHGPQYFNFLTSSSSPPSTAFGVETGIFLLQSSQSEEPFESGVGCNLESDAINLMQSGTACWLIIKITPR